MSKDKPALNISGTFQQADEKRKKDLKDVEKNPKLDDESLYYARLFMED